MGKENCIFVLTKGFILLTTHHSHEEKIHFAKLPRSPFFFLLPVVIHDILCCFQRHIHVNKPKQFRRLFLNTMGRTLFSQKILKLKRNSGRYQYLIVLHCIELFSSVCCGFVVGNLSCYMCAPLGVMPSSSSFFLFFFFSFRLD